ncbi:Interleukin-1 receptor-associated kinase 4, partial [Larimichthys crocea]
TSLSASFMFCVFTGLLNGKIKKNANNGVVNCTACQIKSAQSVRVSVFFAIMNNSITSATYIRNLSYSVRRKLSDFLDSQDNWKDVIVSIRKPSGDLRYSQHHVRRFEGLVAQGKSPTVELLADWGTTNCTVGDLVDILKSHKLLAAANVLLPVADDIPSESQQVSSAAGTYSTSPNNGTGGQQKHSQHHQHNLPPLSCRHRFYRTVVTRVTQIDDVPLEELRVQFNQEIQILQTLSHENLVDMVGFSCDGQYPCLVYALMANGSLLNRLACMQGTPPLSWRQRCSIAEGTARGLDYLHNNHHVHRDIKSANILLDEQFVAKISDFGLTRASAKRTSTTVLLEILSGLPPADENREPQLLMEARYDIEDEEDELTLEDFLDKKMGALDMGQVQSVYSLACNCLEDRKNRRPVSKQVLLELQGVVKNVSLD